MIGTFYRSPNPESDPFVSEGDSIKVGQTICIVEAMKLFNDIESEISAITNDTDGPYWNKQHPDHDKIVQQVYTLREMLNADK